jgi:hypothetical protein
MVCKDETARIAISCLCLFTGGFFGLFVWRHGVISAQADVEWTAGECEIMSGTFREQVGGDQDYFYISFNTRFYHDRTDIESPLTALSNEWGDADHGSVYTDPDWQAAERQAESYRRSVIDCCGQTPNGAVWGYEDSAACAATPKCSQTSLGMSEDYLFLDSAHQGVHTFGCSLCLECCSSMVYDRDPTSYTGYSLTGAYKRWPCYARSEDFDAYVATPQEDRDTLLWLRLHPEQTYDWWNDESTRGYAGPIALCILAALCLCAAGFVCVQTELGDEQP